MHRRNFMYGAVCAPFLIGAVGAKAQTATLQARVRTPTLVAHGGGSLNRVFLSDLQTAIGGRNFRLLLSPYSSKDPSERADRELRKLRGLGYSDVDILDLSSLAAARNQLDAAEVIWFAGGSQRRHMEAMARVTGVIDEIKRAYANGVVMAGSGGGAALMSRLMITGGNEGDVRTGRGVGLWRRVVLDQRVDRRSRQYRLREVISVNRRLLGLGLDDRTWINYSDGIVTVRGRGKVRLVYWSDGIKELEYGNGRRLKLPN